MVLELTGLCMHVALCSRSVYMLLQEEKRACTSIAKQKGTKIKA